MRRKEKKRKMLCWGEREMKRDVLEVEVLSEYSFVLWSKREEGGKKGRRKGRRREGRSREGRFTIETSTRR